MRVLIAPDKFKGTLSADQAARAMADGVRDALDATSLELALRPLADGGEGSHDCLRALHAGDGRQRCGVLLEEARMNVSDSVGRPITATYLTATDASDGTARHYLETAAVIGLELPGARDVSILDRTTAGVGQWLANLLSAQSAQRLEFHLFLGGSATSDGGFGLARALGFRFFGDSSPNAKEILRFRDVLEARAVQPPAIRAQAIDVFVYTDVQNPLNGPTGAAQLFGPQKGASADEVRALEERLLHLGHLLETITRNQQVSSDRANAARNANDSEVLFRRPGTGAAGGLALPLLYWPGARTRFRSGIDFFLEAARIAETLRDFRPDFILTGEGRTDRGSLQGKVVAGLGRLCAANAARPDAQTASAGPERPPRFMIVSGDVPPADRAALAAAGFSHVYDCTTRCGARWPLTATEAADRLRETTAFAVRDMLSRRGRDG